MKSGPPTLRWAKVQFEQIEAYAASLANHSYISKEEVLDISKTAGKWAAKFTDEALELDEKRRAALENINQKANRAVAIFFGKFSTQLDKKEAMESLTEAVLEHDALTPTKASQ